MHISMAKGKSLNAFISSTWEEAVEGFSGQRKKVYQHAFGEPVPSERIKEEISNILYK